MGALIKEICSGIRGLLNRPAFAVTSTLSLALAIGVCAIVFSIFNAVLLQQLPHPNADQLVEVKQINSNGRRMNLCDSDFDPLMASQYE
jgi:hypothetical protein